MRLRNSWILGILAITSVISIVTAAYAQTPALTNGLNYLSSTQNPDGSWGSDTSGTEILPSTVSTIEILQALDQSNIPSYSAALSWLQSQGLETTDYLSERIHALSVSGADNALLLSYLDDLSGAWGGYSSFEVNNLDTLLALQALKKINYSDQSIVSSALYFLTSNQNPDGGWGFYQGDDSNVYMTAMVLNSLSQFKSIYNLQTPINNAVSYLLTKQNPDGGFGSSPSTVYETSLAFGALIASGAVGAEKAANIQNAINYLTSTQLPNGSWNDDPYSTALALRALADVKPNFSISTADIAFSNQTPTRGETVTITAAVHNTGPTSAENVLVRVFDGDPTAGGVQIGTDQIIPVLEPYGATSVSVTYDTTGKIGRHEIYVRVDPTGTLEESNETDNIASSFVTINTLPDLFIDSGEITYEPTNPTSDVPLKITFLVRNLGEKAVENVLTKLYKGQPGAGGLPWDQFTIPTLWGKSLYPVIATLFNPTPGVNTFCLVADPDNVIAESNESNNIACTVVIVDGTKAADLSIFPSGITFSPTTVNFGDNFTVNAVVNNTGSTNITTDVAFYGNDPSKGGTLIGRKTITVPALGTQMAQVSWTLPASVTSIYVVVDPDNVVAETDKANNVAYKYLFSSLPDFVVYDAAVTYSPAHPTPRSTLTIAAVLANNGGVAAYPFMALYDGAPESGGRLLGWFSYPAGVYVDAYGNLIGTIKLINNSLSVGEHTLYVIADPDNRVEEIFETNNRAKIKVTISNDPKTDLSIAGEDITFSPVAPLAGQQVTITANIHNSGSETVSLYYVSFFNGNPSQGGKLIGRVLHWVTQESSRTATMNFTMTNDIPKIYVVVDDDNRVVETNENNNIAFRTIDTYNVDLLLSSADISLDPVIPVKGDTETVRVTVHSVGIISTSGTLKLYEGTPESGRLIGSQDFSTNGNQITALSFPSYIYPGDGATLTAVIENVSPVESDPTNNRATVTFGEHIEDGTTNEGTDFWIAWPEVYSLNANIVVQSKYDASVTVKAPSFRWNGTVSRGFPAVIPLTDYTNDQMRSDGLVENKGIHITSDKNVSVIFHTPFSVDEADDNYLALPTNMLGTEYYFLSYTAWGRSYPAFYVVVATEDNTNIELNGPVFNGMINLNKGQTYQIKKDAYDHSGTHVRSDKPIVYIAGTKCSNVTTVPFIRYCDSLLEEMLPISLLGTDYYTAPLYSPKSAEVFRILAVEDGTEVTIKDKYYTNTYSLGKGEWKEYENDYATHVTSNNPIMIAQFSKGYDAAGLGDPSQITIIPTDKLKSEYRFYTYPGYDEGTYFTVVAPEPDTTVMLDGGLLNSWAPLPDKGSYSLMPSTEGEHVITSDKPVAVYAHGYRPYGSYGYPAGIALPAPNLVVSDLTANPPRPSDGQLVEITATLSNEGDKSAKEVIVRAYNGDPAEGGVQIGGDIYFDILYPKETKTVTFTWDSHGYAGINNIYVVADPLNTVKESNELDDAAMIIVEVVAPSKPDPTVTASDITLSQGLVNEGGTVTLTVRIKNRGAAVGDIPVSLYLGDPASGGTLIESTTIRPIVPLNGEASLTFTLNTLGYPEMSDLFVVIDPQNVIDELIETNNKASMLLRVNRKKLSLDVNTDKTQYDAQSTVGINVHVKNQSISPWSGTGDVYVEDSAGNQIAHVASFTVDDLKPLGLENWGYRVPITVTKASDMKDAIAISYVNFSSLFSSLGLTGKTIDLNSIRVLEFDSSGSVVGEKKARFDKANGFDLTANPSGRLLWLMDGVTPPNTPRRFQLYFDTVENGPKSPFLSTGLPEKGRLIAFTGYWGDIYTVTSNGDGTFGAKTSVSTLTYSLLNGIGLADFNNDGFPDLISGDEYRNIYYLQNKADGSDTFLPKVKIGNIGVGTTLQAITSADFNNDGNQDFVVNMYHTYSTEASNLYVFLGNGDGTFAVTTIPLSAGTNVRGKTSADFDKDGNMDLVIGDNHGSVLIYYGNGDGTFKTPVEIGNIGKEIFGLGVGDFDGDGYLDIIADGMLNDGIAYIIKGMAGGEFKPVELLPSLNTKGRTAYDAVDINGDGKMDVLAAQYSSSELAYFEGNGDGTFKAPVVIAQNTYYLPAVSASRINPEVIATLGAPEKIEGRLYQFTWNTGSTSPGTYRVHVTLSEGLIIVAEKSTSIGIVSDKKIDSKITTDKISYKANETATITSTVTSLSANAILENLTAKMAISGQQSANVLYTETQNFPLLVSGQTVGFKTYWNTGTKPPGAYQVTLTVTDSTGAVLSTSTTTLTISGDIKPSALLKGQISVDKQSILQGEAVNITYSVTNIGNMDLPSIDLSVLSVHVVTQNVYDTLSDHASLVMGQSYSNSQVLQTTVYTAKDYLVILQATIGGTTETLAGTYFRVEGAPSAPSLNSPGNGLDIETLTPALVVNNASDPNDDNLTYEFELYSDSTLTTLIASSTAVPEGTNITPWQVPIALEENSTYYWRARAYDGRLYGDWMIPASFRVNLINDPPTAPTLSAPADNSQVSTLRPVLIVNNASDPDSTNLTYNFDLALDVNFTRIVASVVGIFEGQGSTSWQVPLSLSDNTYYYWRAQADDWLTTGPWMTTARFFVNTVNDAPTAPTIIAPSDDSEIPTLFTDIVITNSTDPDSAYLRYVFEVDTANTFDSPSIMRSGSIPGGNGTTLWTVGNLCDNTFYYVRAKANDGLADSPWSHVIGFFVNTVNEAPSVPLLANPSDAGAVKVFNPPLSVHNSSDPDRDVLTYEFELYGDAAMTNRVSNATNIQETPEITSWSVPVSLTENSFYYWRARAFDGQLYSGWMPLASFMVNTANDAPSAPTLNSPPNGTSLATLKPTLSVYNAVDPDSDALTYDFEVYTGGVLLKTITGVPQDVSGITSMTLTQALSDNTTYTWRSRAYDGDRYGAWMDIATFSTHIPSTNITATINFDPNTLNKRSSGKWVVVYIELPSGYKVSDINIASIRLNGMVPAEPWPYAIGDDDKDGIPDLMVKFNRNAVINLLPNGDNVQVKVTGTVGTKTFEGVDTIRVIP